MLCWTLNIISCMKDNNLKRKPFHVFNNNFWKKIMAIVPNNLFFLWWKSFFFVMFLYVRYYVQVKPPLLNQCRMINLLHIRIDILSTNISKCIYLIIVVCWYKLYVQTSTFVDAFKGIIIRRECTIARHYRIIFI